MSIPPAQAYTNEIDYLRHVCVHSGGFVPAGIRYCRAYQAEWILLPSRANVTRWNYHGDSKTPNTMVRRVWGSDRRPNQIRSITTAKEL